MNKMFVCVFSALLVSTGASANSLSGVTAKYSTDCPMQKNASIGLRFEESYEKIEDATKALQTREAEITKLIESAGSKDAVLRNSNFSLSQRQERQNSQYQMMWRVQGDFNFEMNADIAPQVVKKLADQSYQPSLKIRSMRPSNCKTN